MTQYPEGTQLLIRNQHQGMIWQVYTIRNSLERDLLEQTARANGFASSELSFNSEHAETWPDWRDSDVWKERWANATKDLV